MKNISNTLLFCYFTLICYCRGQDSDVSHTKISEKYNKITSSVNRFQYAAVALKNDSGELLKSKNGDPLLVEAIFLGHADVGERVQIGVTSRSPFKIYVKIFDLEVEHHNDDGTKITYHLPNLTATIPGRGDEYSIEHFFKPHVFHYKEDNHLTGDIEVSTEPFTAVIRKDDRDAKLLSSEDTTEANPPEYRPHKTNWLLLTAGKKNIGIDPTEPMRREKLAAELARVKLNASVAKFNNYPTPPIIWTRYWGGRDRGPAPEGQIDSSLLKDLPGGPKKGVSR